MRKFQTIITKYRRSQLLLTIINDTFYYYLVVFPAVGTAVVAALIYGVIRLWRIDPQSNVMFPLCAIRCGYEMLTPLRMAGYVNSGSNDVVGKWKKVTHVNAKKDMKIAERLQKSCRQLRCRSGSLFAFDSSIYLVTIDNTIQQTVNLLVSFPEL